MKAVRFVLLSLILALSISLCILAVDSTAVPMYDETVGSNVMQIEEGKYVAYRFIAKKPFSSISVNINSLGNNKGSICIGLHKWTESMERTLSSEPETSEQYTDFRNNTNAFLSGRTFEAGEYLIVLNNAQEKVGVYVSKGKRVSYGLLYDNGYEIEGEIKAEVRFESSSESYFTTLKSAYDLSHTVTAPAEIEDDTGILARPDTWYYTDGLGRTQPDDVKIKSADKERYAAIAYWSWHCDFASKGNPRNITKLISQYPDAVHDYNHSMWKSLGSSMFFWNEPYYGYYTTEDRWVIRRHAELLAAAGIDVIFFDNTNSDATWQAGYRTVFEVFAQARKDGVNVPKISFTMHFDVCEDTNKQLEAIYTDIYRQNRFQELWFYWDGKPMMMAYPDMLSRSKPIQSEILDFFTFRGPVAKVQANKGIQTKKGQEWGWLNTYPQPLFYDKEGNLEMTTVGICINWNDKGITAMNGDGVYGRTYTSKGFDTSENAILKGAFFEEQFRYAIEKDPELIFIVGWNEWVAGRSEEWSGVKNAFPDEYSDMFSRDIEPSRGILQDYYYCQLVSFVRQYKGVSAPALASDEKSIDIYGDIKEWQGVMPEFYTYSNNTFERNSVGYGDMHYTNNTGRNDIVLCKVARDSEYIYFMAETCGDLCDVFEPAFMRLFIDTGENSKNWEGYEFVVNRISPSDSHCVLERASGDGWAWEKAADVEYSINANILQLKIPRESIGLTDEDICINFKWVDNTQNDGDIMDFYENGDAAPGGRFMFHYQTKESVVYDDEDKSIDTNSVLVIALCVLVPILLILSVAVTVRFRREKNA